ncbi:MAG: hypothetical protein R2705_02825 [Ilumatobacteraceae bacterium]
MRDDRQIHVAQPDVEDRGPRRDRDRSCDSGAAQSVDIEEVELLEKRTASIERRGSRRRSNRTAADPTNEPIWRVPAQQ